MAKKDPNKFRIKANPDFYVTISKHGRDGYDKDAVWHYVFWYDGKRQRGSTGKLDWAEAKTVAVAEAEKVRDTKPQSTGGFTLKQAINSSLAQRWPIEHAAAEAGETVENESYMDAKGRLNGWSSFVGEDTSLGGLEFDAYTHLVQRYIDKRKANGMKGRTIKNDQLVISNFFTSMMKLKTEDGKKVFPQLVHNPAAHNLLTMPEAETRKLPSLGNEEQKALIKAARGSELWPVIVLCLGAGFRPKGACRSPWSKFDLEQGVFTVTEKGEERHVPLSDWTWKELKTWTASHRPASASQTVWPYHHDTAHDVLEKLRTAHGLSARTTLQALRRTADTLLYAAGVNPQEAARIMGHTVQTAERRYVAFKAVDRATVQALNIEVDENGGRQPHKTPHKRKSEKM